MTANVLFDEPGPQTRRRHRLYGLVFALLVVAVAWWVYRKLDQAGELDQRIFDDLSQSNVWHAIGEGVVNTIKAAALAIVCAVALGLLLATGRLADRAWIQVPSRLVIEFFRAVPVLLMMIFFFSALARWSDLETQTQALIAVVAALTLYNGSVLAEVLRAGINAVPRGQVEAGYAVGLHKGQVLWIVQLPQAVRYMLPAIISQCVVALKDTSLGFVVTYLELLRQGKLIAEYIHNNLMTFILIAVLYITLNSIVAAIAGWLERRFSRRGGGGAVSDVEDTLAVG